MASQVVFVGSAPKHLIPLWREPFVIPVYLAALSSFVLAVQLIWRSKVAKKALRRVVRLIKSSDEDHEEDAQTKVYSNGTSANPVHTGFFSEAKQKIQQQGVLVFVLKVLRALSCLALLAITIIAFIQYEESDTIGDGSLIHSVRKGWGKHGKKKKHRQDRQRELICHDEWIEIAVCAFYTYTSLLSLLSLTLRRSIRGIVTRHLILLLFAMFSIYAYRDIWPLVTFTLKPVDAVGGWLTWSRVGILSFASVLLPLVTPREYIPVDPKNPLRPTPEQTASPLSFMFFSFLDPIVFKAYRIPHLPYDKLPPLADYDHSSYLRATSFPRLDPELRPNKKSRHIFFGLMEQFRGEYFLLAFTLGLQTIVAFASPIGVNRLLNYIESHGEGAIVRPWVWVSFLFLSPLASSILHQLYIFTATRVLVHVEGILTQLIFEHSLRIRMKEETPASKTPTPESEPSATAQGNIEPIVKPEKTSDDAESSNLVGKINNLISTDLENITDGRDFLFVILETPLQFAICIWFLYTILGWSAMVGMGLMVISFPIPGKLAHLSHGVQVERMKKTDERVQYVTEIMNVLRMIKMFGWEGKVDKGVRGKREKELTTIRKYNFLQLLNLQANYILPLITMLATFITYTVIMGNPLTAATVFSALTVFDTLRDQMHFLVYIIPKMIQSKVSLDRVNDFLKTTELLDRHTEKTRYEVAATEFTTPGADINVVGFHNASFTWSQSETGSATTTPSRRNFQLRVDGDLFFEKGKINLIVGPTGSGKTSLLLALLGELHFSPPGPDSWFNLPRDKGIAFSAQEPWILNETIKDNILFGEPFNADRYSKVLYQCALDRDLTLFDAGDETEVGEKGLTLSGGQKARISLARAVYSQAGIVLLDDVLSALDVHTARWIVEKCFIGDLIQGRTLILVTHNIAMTAPIAHSVASIGSDGSITHGTTAEVLSRDHNLAMQTAKENEAEQKAEDVVDDGIPKQDGDKPSGKLIADEEIAEGHVGRDALMLYFSSMGGWGFWVAFLGAMVMSEGLTIVQTWYLGFWASQYELRQPEEVDVIHYLIFYSLIIVIGVLAYSSGFVVYLYGSLRASRRIHQTLTRSLLRTTLRFLDKTPVGRIISRFTRDIRAVDGPLTSMLQAWCEMTVSLLLKLAAIVYLSPIFILPGLAFFLVGGVVGQVYIKAQLSIKREMSNARSPLFSHFGAAIGGLTSIRAYGAEERFKAESLRRVDKYTRPARSFYNLNRWICVRIDGLGGLFAAGLAAYLIYVRQASNASNAGLELNLAVGFTGMLLWWVRSTNELEVQGNSLERIQGYVAIEQEPPTVESGKPPAYWPSSGALSVEKLSARYAVEGPDVLHELSFEIKSGEKVGVVGRTGSGKSSLTLSLLRLIPISGHVVFDGLSTDSINLESLRGSVTIIPQQPELLSGTIRQNLDPFDEHDDAILNDALRSAGLFNLQEDLPEEQRISLESNVSSGGGNFSIGQRQILALARALVRKSKVLILDEATASLDHRTDSLIQKTLGTEFKDCTLITVAHRLQTIMNSDKIMVLDAGRLIEFDSPAKLLQRDSGAFKALVDGSGDREALYGLIASGSE